MSQFFLGTWIWLVATVVSAAALASSHSYTLNFGNEQFGIDLSRGIFIKDGAPFRYIAGEIHYARIHPTLWADRLRRVRHLGLNAIQVYVPWNYHELVPGVIDFESESRDLVRFLMLAHENELNVLLRIGPYICAEFENGGLPWWLLKTPGIVLRTADPRFLESVKAFFDVLLPLVKDQLYVSEERGPVIMVQLENEYGSYGVCDHRYMAWLLDQVRAHLGPKVTLYTTDGPNQRLLSCGTVEGAFATVDFGTEVHGGCADNFQLQHRFSRGGPSVNSECYVTWFSSWGDRSLPAVETDAMLSTFRDMYALNASFSIYMIHGGTNFGFWSGSEPNGPVLTSYDYVAPISEGGDITPAYVALHRWISSLPDWPQKPLTIPCNLSSVAINSVETVRVADLLDVVKNIITDRECLSTEVPAPFEVLPRPYAFVIYSTVLTSRIVDRNPGANASYVLEAATINNIGYVFLDDQFQGIISTLCGIKDHLEWCRPTLTLRPPAGDSSTLIGKTLKILVENIGRISYETIRDIKGLGPITLNKKNLTYWLQCGVDFELVSPEMLFSIKEGASRKSTNDSGPSVYVGQFDGGESVDWYQLNTYFDSRPFIKGFTLVNGFNLGRYWPVLGPQLTLYAPGPIFQRGKNTVIVVELLGREAYCALQRDFDGEKGQKTTDAEAEITEIEFMAVEPEETQSKIRFVAGPIFAKQNYRKTC